MHNPNQIIDIETIPNTLKVLPQWVVYGKRDVPHQTQYDIDKNRQPKTDDNGKPKIDKIPYNAKTGRRAQSNNSETWSDFQTAVNAYHSGDYNGIGFVFSEQDGLAGIDLDHVLNPETGELKYFAAEILEHFPDAYVETSPSGDGLHLWVKGDVQRCGKGILEKAVELYDAKSSRYFTVTGHQWQDSRSEPHEHQAALNWLHQRHFDEALKPKPISKSKTPSQLPVNSSYSIAGSTPSVDTTTSQPFNVNVLLQRARSDNKFISLWQSDWKNKDFNYDSQSEADLALCNKLAFYLQGHPEHMDAAFRRSGLIRHKWDEVRYANGQTYGQHTVQLACENVTEYWYTDFSGYSQHNQQASNSHCYTNTQSQDGSLTPPEQPFQLNDLGNSERLLHHLYCAGDWLIWNGCYWEKDHDLQIER